MEFICMFYPDGTYRFARVEVDIESAGPSRMLIEYINPGDGTDAGEIGIISQSEFAGIVYFSTFPDLQRFAIKYAARVAEINWGKNASDAS